MPSSDPAIPGAILPSQGSEKGCASPRPTYIAALEASFTLSPFSSSLHCY